MKIFFSVFLSLYVLSSGVHAQCAWDQDNTINPPLLVIGGPYILKCPGTAVAMNVQTDATPASYRWTGPNNYSSSEKNPGDILVPGRYTLTATYGAGCTRTQSVDVTDNIPTPPSIDVTGAVISCRNPAVRVSVTTDDPVATFLWTGPAGFDPNTIHNPATRIPGDYTVTVTDKNQCTYMVTTTVQIDTVKPTVTVDDINAMNCTDQDFMLSPTGVGAVHQTPTFAWNGPLGFRRSGRDVTVSMTGQYRLVVRDPVNGCTGSDLMTVHPHMDQPEIDLVPAKPNCNKPQDTMQLTVTNCDNCDIEWQLPDGTVDARLQLPIEEKGKYTVTAIEPATGCISTRETIISIDTLPLNRSFRPLPIACDGPGWVRLFTPSNYTSIEWIDSAQGFIDNADRISRLEPSTIYANTIDKNGCGQRDTFRLRRYEDPEIDFQLSGDTLTCFRDPITVGAMVTNYTRAQVSEYLWTFSDGSTATGQNVPVTVDGPFTVEAVGTNGCRATRDTFVPIDFRQPEVTASGGYFDCVQGSVDLQVSIPSLNIIDVQWSGPRNFWSNRFNPTVNEPGIYTIQVTESNGCTNMDTALVTSQLQTLDALELMAEDINCRTSLGMLAIQNPNPNIVYAWNEISSGASGSFSGVTASVPLQGTYAVIGTHVSTSCVLTDTVQISIDTIRPTASIMTNGIVRCAARTMDLMADATAGVEFFWSTTNGEFLSPPDQGLVVIQDTGRYMLTVTNPINGCTASDDVVIQEEPNDLRSIQIDAIQPDCHGDDNGVITVAEVTGGAAPYQYSVGGLQFGASPMFDNLTEGTFRVYAEDADGCRRDTILDLQRVALFDVDLGEDQSIRLGNG
ncbi:MAG: hypothetical protein KTR24_10345, partial [Saprospiraceae bacterium]|nr:hypothetical protein [Saprospiraceae bacterium]